MSDFRIGRGRVAVADDARYNYCRSHSPPSTSLEIRYCDNLDCLSRQREVGDRYEVLQVCLVTHTCSTAAVDTAAAGLDCDAAQ